MTNRSDISTSLHLLGFSPQESTVYIALLKKPQNHLALSRTTMINRTSIYRITDTLIERGFVESVIGDRGVLLQATPPESLDRIAHETEIKLEQQQQALRTLSQQLPTLPQGEAFTVKTYQGKEALKQMLWKELNTKGEILIFSHEKSLNIAFGKKFADAFRKEIMKRKISQRALQNSIDHDSSYAIQGYSQFFQSRTIAPSELKITQELTILPDRVNVYNWDNGIFIGNEIANADYALFMRNIFEVFWKRRKRALV